MRVYAKVLERNGYRNTHIYIYICIHSSLGLELPHARRHTLDFIRGVSAIVSKHIMKKL